MRFNVQSLHPYCVADADFFDLPERLDDAAERFPAADLATPPGWLRAERGFWVSLRPVDAPLVKQGWKIHVSVTLDDAARVCELVRDFCVRHALPVKMLRSRKAAHYLNNKYAARAGSGKLITVYPADEAALERALTGLSAALAGTTGPDILSDLRYGDSPLFVRHGAFVRQSGTNDAPVTGEQEPAFSLPPWVRVPDVLRPHYELWRSGDDGDDFPYEIGDTLHYANGGGVYRARDVRTGVEVVLREARPHAGLDVDGADAVVRLGREHGTLRRLQGLDCVPRLIEYRRAWEHHFLVEEYVEGETLADAMLHRQPLTEPDPTSAARAEYTAWVLAVTGRLGRALDAVHARGVRVGGLHPGNVIVRPDGSVCLVDFELAGDLLNDRRRSALAAVAFTAPPSLSGAAADRYLLDCIRLWLLLPLDARPAQEPYRVTTLVRAAERLYPLPAGFGAALLRGLRPPEPPDELDTAGALLTGDRLDWPAIRDRLVAGIHACATPGRTDRLFPGDPQQFADGGTSLAYGAAGVLHALHHVGAPIPGEYVDWLVRAADRDPRPGLYTGAHGVAGVLHELGRTEAALELLDRVAPSEPAVPGVGMLDGRAGIGLALLHFARLTGDIELLIRARWTAESIGYLRTPAQGGLFRGTTGAALLHLHLYEDDGDPAHLDRAAAALRADAARGEHLANGSFQLVDAGRHRLDLDAGSGGVALVAQHYLRHRDDAGLAAVVDGVRTGCRCALVQMPGLLLGRAGMLAAQVRLGTRRAELREQVRRLGWHARTYRGQLVFPGHGLLRLSADLGTGAAGVLLAMSAVFDDHGPILPYLDPGTARVPAGCR
jgi:serine/threonine protein kinase